MKYKFFMFISIHFLFAVNVFSQSRSFNDIFPGIAPAVRQAIFSNEGFSKSAVNIPRSSLVGAGQGSASGSGAFVSGIDPEIIESVFVKKPGFLVESIKVIPGAEDGYSLLDVYNALGNIRGLKGRLYHSSTRNENIPLFEEVTRIESSKKNVPVADPPPAARIPPSETIYMRLKDANFGNSYYRGDITLFQRGLRYSLSNNKNISYFFITVIKEEKFTVQLYFEVISEGVLIYSLAGVDVSDFVSSRIDMASAINKRLSVIISWAAEGIAKRGLP
ncbi:MAG: hypothetical protein LBU85_03690 [Treponema sp.]|jgi:hypothetical protein|nr:hypothetical protein [Treponema sp.]